MSQYRIHQKYNKENSQYEYYAQIKVFNLFWLVMDPDGCDTLSEARAFIEDELKAKEESVFISYP